MNDELYSVLCEYDLARAGELLRDGADINCCTELGDSLLSEVILDIQDDSKRGNVVKFMLDQGADSRQLDDEGAGPLYAAVIQQDAEVLRLLLDHGADPNRERGDGNDRSMTTRISTTATRFTRKTRSRGADRCRPGFDGCLDSVSRPPGPQIQQASPGLSRPTSRAWRVDVCRGTAAQSRQRMTNIASQRGLSKAQRVGAARCRGDGQTPVQPAE